MPKRDQGPTVGDYLLLCVINRVLGPKSKSKLGEWYEETVLQRLWKHSPDCFTAQHFWNHMNLIGPEEIKAIETEIAARVVAEYKLDLDCLLYDATSGRRGCYYRSFEPGKLGSSESALALVGTAQPTF